MNKFLTIVSIVVLSLQFTSCKSEAKKEEKKEVETTTETPVEKTAPFAIKNATNSINFTAYKTTDKVPVNGIFKKIEITKGGEGNSIKEAMNGAEFKIPVSSLETKDNGRNIKIRKFFFSVMANTVDLTGKITIDNDSLGTAEFTMNSVTEKLPFKYTINDKVFSMSTTMDIDKWNAQSAIASLNKVCEDLHKGADGVSKTWNEVAINVTSTFK
ncbi:YceI family protein [uncultured Tenacibaculum sp.]|uniref:YceI family protein n=1 Tax=uncultured Tenacibaculum sp. TaxID=174713 RepID=UPI0026304397|nr:YceI family protein [uncultured Tenacibaculum sp.]